MNVRSIAEIYLFGGYAKIPKKLLSVEAGQLSELVFQKETYQYWQVRVQPEAGGNLKLYLFSMKIFSNYTQNRLNILPVKNSGVTTLTCLRMFDDVGYAYALTTHKAQGSTIDYVFLDVNDMKGCSERQKLLYTALTRAKQQALIPQ